MEKWLCLQHRWITGVFSLQRVHCGLHTCCNSFFVTAVEYAKRIIIGSLDHYWIINCMILHQHYVVHVHILASVSIRIIWRHCVLSTVCDEWSYIKSLLTCYLINRPWELHKIYNFGAVGNKDELIKFWGQIVKGQGRSQATYGQIITLGGIFSSISRAHGHVFYESYNYSFTRSADMVMFGR